MELLGVVSAIAFEGQNSAALPYHVSACGLINRESLKVTTTTPPREALIKK